MNLIPLVIARLLALFLRKKSYINYIAGDILIWGSVLQYSGKFARWRAEVTNVLVCRMGETVDRTLLKHLLRMFSALGIYSESFERQFLDCTAEFYAAEGTRFMQQTDVPDYLKHVEVSWSTLDANWLSIQEQLIDDLYMSSESTLLARKLISLGGVLFCLIYPC